jgi:hypothetical protein
MSVLQPFPPGSAAQVPFEHWPVQHGFDASQPWPAWRHVALWQTFPTQESEQHSPDEMHAPP